MIEKPWPREWCDDGKPMTGTVILEKHKQEYKCNVADGFLSDRDREIIYTMLLRYEAPNRLFGAWLNEEGEAV